MWHFSLRDYFNVDSLCLLLCILKNVSSIDERERRNSRSFALDLPPGLEDLMTVDLFEQRLSSVAF